jgi:hypothetical protein
VLAILQSESPDTVARFLSFPWLTGTLEAAPETVHAGVCEIAFFIIRQLRNGGDAIASGFLEAVMAQLSAADHEFRVGVLTQFARCVVEGSEELIMYVANLQVFGLFQELLEGCEASLCEPVLSAFGALFTMLAKTPGVDVSVLDISGLEDHLVNLFDLPDIGPLAQAVQDLIHNLTLASEN